MRLDLNTEHLLEIIRKFRNVRIAVLGEMMLDVYFWGKATRSSPEAPVPVVEVERITRCLGGAANVMRNIVTLGGSAAAVGIVGDDAEAAELEHSIDAAKQENLRLEQAIDTLDTDEGVVTAARQKLGWVTEGEIVFYDMGN